MTPSAARAPDFSVFDEEYYSYTHFDSMTAITYACTKEGFVIGADSRSVDTRKNIVLSDTKTKVNFFEDGGGICLAYAWTGFTEGGSEENPTLFDLRRESERALRAASVLSRDSFNDFLHSLCSHILGSLVAVLNAGPDTKEVARAIFLGYYDGYPCLAVVYIRQKEKQWSVTPERISFPCGFHKCVLSGSKRVYQPFQNIAPQTELEALNYVFKYIQQCIDSEDEDCKDFGGKVHIARVTLDDGCEWIIQPS